MRYALIAILLLLAATAAVADHDTTCPQGQEARAYGGRNGGAVVCVPVEKPRIPYCWRGGCRQ